jgi:plasmid stability protein
MIAFKQGGWSVAQLLVRKIPDDVMDGIRKAASAEGLSVEEFARRVLRQQSDQRNRWREFAAWSRGFTGEQKKSRHCATDTTKMIREDRGR